MKIREFQALGILVLTTTVGIGCDPTTTVNGSVRGVPYTTVNSALSSTVTSSKGEFGWVLLSNSVNLCSKLQDGAQGRMDQRLEIAIYTVDENKVFHAPSKPGVFQIDVNSAGPYASLSYVVTDTNCHPLSSFDEEAVSGTVTLTAASPGHYSGSFDVTLGSGDRLRGTFDPDNCAASGMATAANQPETLSCR